MDYFAFMFLGFFLGVIAMAKVSEVMLANLRRKIDAIERRMSEQQAAEPSAPPPIADPAPLAAPTVAIVEAQLVDLRAQQAEILRKPARSLPEVMLRQALGESIDKLEGMLADERVKRSA